MEDTNFPLPINSNSDDDAKIPSELPILPLRDTVAFPNIVTPLVVAREKSVKLINEVISGTRILALVAQKQAEVEEPNENQIYEYGIAATILRMLKFPDGSLRVLVQGITRIKLLKITQVEPYLVGKVRAIPDNYEPSTELEALNTWINQQTGTIPQENRQIVTDHMLFGYFAEKYGFNVVGAIIPSYSSGAEPSARELAELEDSIRQFDVKVILVGNTVNPSLAARIADDTGIRLVQFYTGSLSEADGPAATYIEYMRFNVNAIVSALE